MEINKEFETGSCSTLSHDDSAISLNESFVNLSNISNLQSSGKLPNLNWSVKKQKTGSRRKNPEPREPCRYNLRGISSFQGFELSPPTNSFLQKSFDSKSLENESFTSKENKSNLSNYCPNILKHVKKEPLLKGTSTPNSSPLKVLEFSPSRFLNTSSEDLKTEAVGLDVVRELSFSSFDVEDSGISGSDGDVTAPISPPSLTSTPKGKRSRRKESLTFLTPEIFSSPEFSGTKPPPEAEEEQEDNLMKTPLIRRFLNESTPLTPTPFKCPVSKHETDGVSCLGCEDSL
ncbi:uncharacterized protein LOC100185371 [Ciona intestinalis]